MPAEQSILVNDNGAWCWFQDERTLYDPDTDRVLIGSVPAAEGPGGEARAGNIELTELDLATGTSRVAVLHERLETDDHDVPALWLRPDGRYLAMYARHKTDDLSRWRISAEPHDPSAWEPEQTFDWSELTGGRGATYSNLHYLAAEGLLYIFVRSINDDPSIMLSEDNGYSWRYGGKLFTEPKIGYVNGYTRYASNGTDRIDLITTDHHPRDFDNRIFHGYLRGGALHRADGTVTDPRVIGGAGTSQTGLTTIFDSGQVIDGDPMSHAWTCDLRRNAAGELAAIITCRAGEESALEDRRFFYGRLTGTDWRVRPLAKAGPPLWAREQDYTGLGAIDPADLDTLYLSTPIDPRTGDRLAHHEIFAGHTDDQGGRWDWRPITADSPVDNLRPIVVPGVPGRTVLLWFRGTMTRSQHYAAEVVARILPR
ncbi:BNR-4 repeat-containing protein [Microlunatus speluncae]|uniref:BNR-4 repeat-containing protein n=1 Tax=Microlunatus speluncae TaxID=2594267 RepID=UPI00126685FC|nr:BNR-4 repeat-containing protein [Microlunatus speluncae]